MTSARAFLSVLLYAFNPPLAANPPVMAQRMPESWSETMRALMRLSRAMYLPIMFAAMLMLTLTMIVVIHLSREREMLTAFPAGVPGGRYMLAAPSQSRLARVGEPGSTIAGLQAVRAKPCMYSHWRYVLPC